MKLDLRVPTSLNDIPLHQYQKFIKTFENEKELTNDYAATKMLEIFCGLKLTEALKIKIADMRNITAKLNKALSEKPLLITRFKLGSTEFGFVPQLDDLTFGEFVDVENNIGDWETMHKAMAVLYRPVTERVGKKYAIEEYRGDSWHDAMLNMPASVAVSAITFFFHLENDLLKVTLPYSAKAETEIQQEKQTTLTNNGGGITAL
jgi:hypothetical protein|tara:strand:+ start:5427 stop:6041 length:615 start_codon:yes stop_codon:yes gene_type:complete